jgi:hypothetical protein
MDSKIAIDIMCAQQIPNIIMSPYSGIEQPHVYSFAVCIHRVTMDKLSIRDNFDATYTKYVTNPYPCSYIQELYFALVASNYILYRKQPIINKRRICGQALARNAYNAAMHLAMECINHLTLLPYDTANNDRLNHWIEYEFIYPLYRYGTFGIDTISPTEPPTRIKNLKWFNTLMD